MTVPIRVVALRAATALACLAALGAWAQVPPTSAEIAAYTGLHAAAHRGDVATIRGLAAANRAALEERDRHGRTPLHLATCSTAHCRLRCRDRLRAASSPSAAITRRALATRYRYSVPHSVVLLTTGRSLLVSAYRL